MNLSLFNDVTFNGILSEQSTSCDLVSESIALDGLFPSYFDPYNAAILGFEVICPLVSLGISSSFVGSILESSLDTLIKISSDSYAGSILDSSLDTLIKVDTDSYSDNILDIELDTLIKISLDSYSGSILDSSLFVTANFNIDSYSGSDLDSSLDTLIKVDTDSYSGSSSIVSLSTIIVSKLDFVFYDGSETNISLKTDPFFYFPNGQNDFSFFCDYVSSAENNLIFPDPYCTSLTIFNFLNGNVLDLSLTKTLIYWEIYSDETLEVKLDDTIYLSNINFLEGTASDLDLTIQVNLDPLFYSGSILEQDLTTFIRFTLDSESGSILESSLDTLIKISSDSYAGSILDSSLDTLIKISSDFYSGSTASIKISIRSTSETCSKFNVVSFNTSPFNHCRQKTDKHQTVDFNPLSFEGTSFSFDLLTSFSFEISSGESIDLAFLTDLNVSFTNENDENLYLDLITYPKTYGGSDLEVINIIDSRRLVTVTIEYKNHSWKETLKIDSIVLNPIRVLSTLNKVDKKSIKVEVSSLKNSIISVKVKKLR